MALLASLAFAGCSQRYWPCVDGGTDPLTPRVAHTPKPPEEASPSRASRRSTLPFLARLSVGLSWECAKTSWSGRVRKRESLPGGRKAPFV